MDAFEKTISNLIEFQFPDHYRSDGPILIAFIKKYYEWMEGQSNVAYQPVTNMTVAVHSGNATIVASSGNSLVTNFSNGQEIAIRRDDNFYDLFTINAILSNTTMTVYPTPSFTNLETVVYDTTVQDNPLYQSRRLAEYHDIDETVSDYLVYFKEKYLKDLQFSTSTDIREIVKHSLDIYRSKGSERGIDLLFRLIFGSGAEVYYPKSDIFRLSDGKWKKPTYLEVSLGHWNVLLHSRQIRGAQSGAVAFVESVVRRTVRNRLVDVLYISPISGHFETGELIDTEDSILSSSRYYTTVIGSLTSVSLATSGAGANFSPGDVVDIYSSRGAEGKGRVVNVSAITGKIDFELLNGGYGYSNSAVVLVSEKILVLQNVIVNTTANVYFNVFETFTQPLANITYNSANGVGANIAGNVAVSNASRDLTGDGTDFVSDISEGDDIFIYGNATHYDVREVISITNTTSLTLNALPTYSNAVTKAGEFSRFAQNSLVYSYYANGDVAGTARILSLDETNVTTGEMLVSEFLGNVQPISTANDNLAGLVAVEINSYSVVGASPGTNTATNAYVLSSKDFVTGTGTVFDQDFVYPSDNCSGTISINSTSTTVTGTGTSFTTLFSNSEYIVAHVNSSHYETRQINVVGNATSLTLKQAFSFANATANFSIGYPDEYVAAFRNSTSYEIRGIESIANSTQMNLVSRFSFTNVDCVVAPTVHSGTKFKVPNANLTGTVSYTAACTVVTGTGTNLSVFAAGDLVGLWDNSTHYVIGEIEEVTNSTSIILTRPVKVANASSVVSNVTANAAIVYGSFIAFFTDVSDFEIRRVNAIVNDTYFTVQDKFSHSNSLSVFANADVDYSLYAASNAIVAVIEDYVDKTATGNVIGVSSNLVLAVDNVSGTFLDDERIRQVDGASDEIANGNFTQFSPTIGTKGILRASNTARAFKNSYMIVGESSNARANVTSIQLSVGLINVERTFLADDWNYVYSESLISNGAVLSVSVGTGASFNLSSSRLYPEYIQTTDTYIRDYADTPMNAPAYFMPGDPDGNLTNNTIANIIGLSNTEFGKLYSITSEAMGNNYTTPPFVLIYDPRGYFYGRQDDILTITGISGGFSPGELVTQEATGARGIVKSTSNTTVLHLERLYLLAANSFIPTINSTTIVVGDETASTANITATDTDHDSDYLALNANVDAILVAANGAVTNLQVVASGYGFVHGEHVTFAGGNGESGNGIAVLEREGVGQGYYDTRGGFLSDKNKLFDGTYYQNFSYEVQSKIALDRYEDMLKKVLHVAGTKYFAGFIHSSVANAEITHYSSVTLE